MSWVPALQNSIYGQESSWGKADTSKPNSQNVRGPMQVMQSTFEGLKRNGVIPQDYQWDNPEHNLAAGKAHVADLWNRFSHIKNEEQRARAVAAAYYGGEKAVRPDGSIVEFGNRQRPTDPTTVQYADKVVGRIKGGKTPPAVSATTDPNADFIAQAKAHGFTDEDIAYSLAQHQKHTGQREAALQKVKPVITELAAKGRAPYGAIQLLREAGYGDVIDQATEQGFSDEDIVYSIAPDAWKAGREAATRAEQRGLLGRTVDAAKDRLGDLGNMARQAESFVTGNDAELLQEQQELVARMNDPDRQARSGNWGGELLDAAITVPLTLATGGTGLVARAGVAGGAKLTANAALGAAGGVAYGATLPTEEGKFADPTNMVVGAAVGGALPLAGKAVSSIYRKGGEALENARTFDDRLAAEGERLRKEAVKGMTARAGLMADDVTTTWVDEAKKRFNREFDSFAPIKMELSDDAATALQLKAGNRHIDGKTRGDVNDLLPKNRTEPVTMRELQTLASDLSSDLANPNLSSAARRAKGELFNEIDGLIKKNLQDAKLWEDYANLKDQYRHFKVVSDLVPRTGDGRAEISSRVIEQAIKSGKYKNSFKTGNAPFQDLMLELRAAEAQLAGAGQQSTSGKVLKAAAKVLDAVPGGRAVSALPTVRSASALMGMINSGKVPEVAKQFYKLDPWQQSVITRAAAPGAKAADKELADKIISGVAWDGTERRKAGVLRKAAAAKKD